MAESAVLSFLRPLYPRLSSALVLMIVLGGFVGLEAVWIIADIVNALMALPNLIALLVCLQLSLVKQRNILTHQRTNFSHISFSSFP